MRGVVTAILLVALAGSAIAAPDEDALGKAQGYPVGTAITWRTLESVRVGSFTAQGEIPGIANGGVKILAPSDRPMPLPKAESEPDFRWEVSGQRNLSIDDYLSRQRVMGPMIIKDGVIQVERYQYDRRADHRFLSNSMAKSILSLAVGFALEEGKIRSLEDRADAYVSALAGALYGETTLRNLLRMASGARYVEVYDGKDDAARFSRAVARDGIEAAASVITEREAPQGTKFNYASAESAMLGAVLRHATGEGVSAYLTPRLWQAIGAETSALWRTDRTGLEWAAGNFNATLRDYARLAIVLANDGVRPDDPSARQIIPRDYLLDATDWRRAPDAFRPRTATSYYGYGYQFWLFPTEKRRFALLGVYGQMIFIDPELKLIMLHVAANATAKAGGTTMAAEANALFRGVVRRYGSW